MALVSAGLLQNHNCFPQRAEQTPGEKALTRDSERGPVQIPLAGHVSRQGGSARGSPFAMTQAGSLVDNAPIEDRRFSDKEMREILKKAVESASGSTSLARQDGHSLADLRAIAAEVGIDPARLEEAARAVAGRGRTGGLHILGGPTNLHIDRSVPGTIPPERYPETLAAIRRELRAHGEASEIHGSLEWTDRIERGERHVALTSRDGETRITAGARLTQAAIVTFLPASIIGTMASIITFVTSAEAGNPAGMILAFFILPTLWSILRQVMKRISGSQEQGLERAVAEVARIAAEGQAEPIPGSPAGDETP